MRVIDSAGLFLGIALVYVCFTGILLILNMQLGFLMGFLGVVIAICIMLIYGCKMVYESIRWRK